MQDPTPRRSINWHCTWRESAALLKLIHTALQQGRQQSLQARALVKGFGGLGGCCIEPRLAQAGALSETQCTR
jgi:hypothetical protein